MWRNYLTVGLRSLAKNKTYAFINIVGLTIGLTACLLILLYVRYEQSYDRWLPDADRTFQLQNYILSTSKGGEQKFLQLSPIVAGRTLAKDFPQVEKVAWVRAFSPIVIQNGRAIEVNDLQMTDSNLFEVLDLPLVRGTTAKALPDSHSLSVSESEAKRRFGDSDPIGKTLTIVDNTGDVDYRITSVFKDIPKNSSFSANMIARFDLDTQFADRQRQLTRWTSTEGWNFVKLKSAADAALINAQLPAWKKRNIPDDVINGQKQNPGDGEDFALVNISNVHLGKAQMFGMTPGNDARTVTTFAVIAALVLGMAAINFTNLATARASQRAREVALRKVLGATRRQLITQFLAESTLLVLIAMLVALAMAELLLPAFNSFLDASIALRYLGAESVLIPAALLVLAVGAAGGFYPALYLSRFQPAKILKANKSSADAAGSGRLRNLLVLVQFAVSIGLIACTAIIYGQTLFARTLDAGYQRDRLLQVGNVGFRGVSTAQSQALVERIRRVPGVQAAGRTQIGIASSISSISDYFLPGSPTSVPLGTYGVEPGFLEAMGIKLLAGRYFSEMQGKDDATTPVPVDLDAERALAARGINVIVTQSAAQRLGFRTPEDAIGKEMRGDLSVPEAGLVPATIVGVVSDARYRSLREPVQPIVYIMQRVGFAQVAVRYAGTTPTDIRQRIEGVWKQLIPLVPFKAEFADDIVQRQYQQESARGILFAGFSLLAVVIGCMGLFGLAVFTAERLTKEIGIRKVLGARTQDIVRLLVWQFSRPVLLANIIAWPVAWWLMRDWLNGFDTRIPLTPVPFLIAGIIALAVALSTIASHAFRVARLNPIHALRYE
ncbi:FtsX-like permease family protein [Sphingomonas panacisoli]|uniref:FtsX-like permease family protein n=1 Tax=Sphingomonas panacisoli TaxID=1813879 RepID=A0A5B8LJ30_9SPHN|nr:ABC transporter permease [Sphingomonas panacisoli]QDZ08287.1 FtsX-like permease family protein [Sphingomonas panacisoli]